MPIHDKVRFYAEHNGNQIAVNIDENTLTYKALWNNALALYGYISAIPTGKNEKHIKDAKVIAIMLGNSVRFPEAYLAATVFPNVCAVIDPNIPYTQLAETLEKLSPDLIIIGSDRNDIQNLAQALKIDCLCYDDPFSKSTKISFFEDKKDGYFLIYFTSGTTSFPKALLRSRQSWRNSFDSGYTLFFLNSVINTFCPCPIFHGIGLYCLNETLYSGSTFYSLSKWNNDIAYKTITRHSIDRLVVVPSMVVSLGKIFRTHVNALSNVKYILTAGAKLDINKYLTIRDMLPNAIVQEYYGASELSFISVSLLDDENIDESIDSVGYAFPGVNIVIRDEHGNALANGETGYIYVNSELIADRYLWGDDGKAFHVTQNGATVGDMGYIDEHRRLHVLGRTGGMILTGGYNVYLSEVEKVLRSMPEIDEAIVLAIADEYLGSKIVSIIEGHIHHYSDVVAYCSTHLPRYKIPKDVYTINKWPMTSSGKIKRKELEKMINSKEASIVKLPT
ncbi:AMP-binding protein [Pectobacterium sp. A5351]|uniref:AMP-binding protein n=1 Tax=Pectobacterium sp. A5351 TaxID=2914983 RepID=UPI00232E2940|nr:AMP-binding protein [Pectobacterium sp. A5351]WCG82654.1 AMP-binding protein [Pectobacterium sp. A5351]